MVSLYHFWIVITIQNAQFIYLSLIVMENVILEPPRDRLRASLRFYTIRSLSPWYATGRFVSSGLP